jgi:hypothetical protein
MLRRGAARIRQLPGWGKGLIALAGLAGTLGGGFAVLTVTSQFQSDSNRFIQRWFNDRAARAALITMQRTPCEGAPFLLPSDGLIGLLWRDPAGPYSVLRRHTGVDIFGDGAPGAVPVYAAYSGALTRLPDWVSTVIIRHNDPLHPGRTIWTYYTHMASQDGRQSYIADRFPPGTSDVPVEQGTLLGYQGEYAGAGRVPIGMHVHFSIVRSEPDGSFKNEARLGNTLDPSPYLGMPLNISARPQRPIRCR